MPIQEARYQRRADDPWKLGDDRRQFEAQRDRDRILYASAFRRLAEVTQVVSPSGQQVFHNRLTHSLKVAQVGRASAAWLLDTVPELAEAVGGIDPYVVEAAALAHDLGHPPFGHLAERELQKLLESEPIELSDSFEGNAQSFRIVTKLAVHDTDRDGLNLTRATLNAILKYPWLRGSEGKRAQKWGAYLSERDDFVWAREGQDDTENRALQSAEAAIMDWADDVAYSVHDAEDFYRAGLIPLDTLRREGPEQERFLERAIARIGGKQYDADELRAAFKGLAELFPIVEAYTGTRWQRAGLRSFTSNLIGNYIRAVSLTPEGDDARVAIDPEREKEVIMLKELTWCYVIHNPALATQQYGQRQIVRGLFSAYMDAAATPGDWLYVFPASYRERLDDAGTDSKAHARIVVDLITSMTEEQATTLHARLTGTSPEPVLAPLGL